MKYNNKETIVIILHLLCLYLLPFVASYISKDSMVLVVFINVFNSLILSLLLSRAVKARIAYLYPFVIALAYIPSMYIFYDGFILIYLLLHIMSSFIGIILGRISQK